jgi:hypothetical protein
MRAFMIGAVSAAALMLSTGAFAQQSKSGTAEEAKAMLTKAIAAVKADKTKAIDMFNKGEGGFRQGDLYPYCFNISDGKVVATQIKQGVGTDIRTLKDPTGKPFGLEIFAAAKDGQITEAGGYMFPRPGTGARSRRRTPLPVEPDVFHTPAVKDAVDHHRYVLEIRIPAGSRAAVEDDRPSKVLGQLPFDLPDQLFARSLVGLH